mmetsp:Transcript_34240/g.107466  ORF Transcript_34240/g.107466 Transcript_34240/m.107466 type:complete len:743 (+) Transcript_34240:146-2374(+)
MSGHPRDKHPGAGASPSHKAAAPPPKQRNRELRADFLLNFQRPPAHQRPQQAYAPPRRSRPSGRQYQPVAFTKGRFVQSAFRLYVEKITPDVAEAALNPDSLVRWESVHRVDLLCEQLPKCPICLEVDMIVPKITKCGHVFCAPCVMRYFMCLTDYNGKKYQRCPVCNEQVCPEELTSARFEGSKALRENDRASFVLAHRDVTSTVVRLSPAAAAGAVSPALPEDEGHACSSLPLASPSSAGGGDPLQLPSRGQPGWHFSRLLRLQPGEAARLLDYELEALRSFRMVASSDGEKEILPSIDAAMALTRKQRVRTESGDSPAPAAAAAVGCEGTAAEDLLLPAPAADLPDEGEADDDATSIADAGEAGDPGPGPSGSAVASPAAGPSSASPAPDGASSSSPGLTASNPAVRSGGGRPHIMSFYQAADGRLVFLEPFFTRLLLHEHGGRWDGLPAVLENLRLERLQEITVSEDARGRHRFLQHLPLGSVAQLAEVDLRNLLGQDTKNHFAEEFLKRRQQRKKEQIRTRKEERISKSRAAEEEERYYQALNLTHPTTVQQLPTAEDFAAPLPGREVETVAEGDGEAAGAEGEAAGDASDGSANSDAGPTLAEKIKGKMAAKARVRNPALAFPELGGGRAAGAGTGSAEAATAGRGTGSSSAWGPRCGSSRVKKAADEAPEAGSAAQSAGPVDSWDEPTFGEALEAALRSAAEPEQPNAEGATGGAAGGKKKKGRAGKATTIRLFG